MKNIFTIFTLLAFSLFYSQIFIPANSSKGKIITQTDQIINYTNLKYDNGKVTYFNTGSNTEEFLYDNSVKSIQYQDADGTAKYSGAAMAETTATKPVEQKPKLTSNTDIKNYLLEINDPVYIKGKRENSTGNAFLVGGAACFATGAIINLSKSNEVVMGQSSERAGSPVPLIIGLAGMGVGVIFKISGHSKMKKAINEYKTAQSYQPNTEYFVLADAKGFGLKLKF